MYITINDIKGEKRIDLSYSINSDKEITVIIMLSDNVKYQVLKLCSVMDSDSKKLIPSGTHASRELLSMLGGMVELNHFLICHRALVKRLLSQGRKVNHLSNTFKKFYGRRTDLVGQYKKGVCQMFADSIS